MPHSVRALGHCWFDRPAPAPAECGRRDGTGEGGKRKSGVWGREQGEGPGQRLHLGIPERLEAGSPVRTRCPFSSQSGGPRWYLKGARRLQVQGSWCSVGRSRTGESQRSFSHANSHRGIGVSIRGALPKPGILLSRDWGQRGHVKSGSRERHCVGPASYHLAV